MKTTNVIRLWAAIGLLLGLVLSCSSNEANPGTGQFGNDPLSCTLPQVPCPGNICASLASDSANCGQCGGMCPTGSACSASQCVCQGTLSPCAQGCRDFSSDSSNCGGCDRICSSGSSCMAGNCQCQAGLEVCGTACTNTQSDGANCGTCGTLCPTNLVCSQGACAAGCAPGLMQCGQSCVDSMSDSLNCGTCGTACPGGQACNGGSCGCGPGQMMCGSQCANTSSDVFNCGGCGTTCSGGEVCAGGSCGCPAGQVSCNGTCVATGTCNVAPDPGAGGAPPTGVGGAGNLGTAGVGGAGVGPAPPPAPTALSCTNAGTTFTVAAEDVISDFAQVTPLMYQVGERGGTAWYSYSGTPETDPSTPPNTFEVDAATSGPCSSGGSLHFTSAGNTAFGMGVGVNFLPDVVPLVAKGLYNAQADSYTGVGFWMMCTQDVEFAYFKIPDEANDEQVMTPTCRFDGVGARQCNQYGTRNNTLIGGRWTYFPMYFSETLQDWDAAPTSFGSGLDITRLTALQLQINSRYDRNNPAGVPNAVDCWVDDVHFLRAPAPQVPPQPPSANYTTSGNQILDGNGQTKLFRGLARPSFEWDTAGFGITREDIQRMRTWGANVIRYSLNQARWLEGQSQYNPLYKAYVQRAVNWTLQEGMDVIIDLHWSQDNNPTNPGAQRNMADRISLQFWQDVVSIYGGDRRILFELYNEPHDVTPAVWRNGDGGTFAGMQEMVDVIRGVNSQNLVLAGGLSFAYDLSHVPANALTGGNIVYVTHPYLSQINALSEQNAYLTVAQTFPVMATEFGDFDLSQSNPNFPCNQSNAITNRLTAFGNTISWTAWAWLVDPLNCGFPTLLTSYSGQPNPNGMAVLQALGGSIP